MATPSNSGCPLRGSYLFCYLDDDGEGPLYHCNYIGKENECPANIVKQSEKPNKK